MMTVLFWTAALFVAYVYVGYPAGLAIWAYVRRPTGGRRPTRVNAFTFTPGVSIIIAARNEADRLPERIRNLLSLDYPAAKRQIIVVSDGSTDNTEAAVAPFDVDFVALPACGKAAALNAGVARARHDVLVFADARQAFARGALRALVAPLADSTVGGITGELVLGCEESKGRRTGAERRGRRVRALKRDQRAGERRGHRSSTVGDGVGLYWRYEKWLRRLESDVWSTLGATGAIYALRRSLWRPLPDGTILDDVLAPMRAVLAGPRVLFSEAAQAYDHTPADSLAETRRKVRTLAGNVQILALEPRLLVPFVNPVWLQYFSHKVGRLLVPYALIALMASSIALATRHAFYTAVLATQCVFYLLGGYGAWLEWRASRERLTGGEPGLATGTAGRANSDFDSVKDVVNA
jgi:cellulose synthase/poly-beta-1,6-N-acetylglucosamine synthase-like glycosyltransferase